MQEDFKLLTALVADFMKVVLSPGHDHLWNIGDKAELQEIAQKAEAIKIKYEQE